MELLRIVAMFLILVLHSNFFTIGEPSANDIIQEPIVSTTRVLVKALSIIGVNVFVLLSGWYGIKFKFNRLLGLFFQILFFNAIGIGVAIFYSKPINCLGALGLDNTYWFINAYLLLYILSPALNLFCESCDKNQFEVLLIAFFVFQTLYGWYPCDTPWIYGGSSTISFIGLYMLAKYLRRFEPIILRWSWWRHIVVYLVMALSMSIIVSFQIKYSINPINRIFYYTSPFLIIASTAFVLLFSKIQIKSKLINWIAASSLAVYLFHMNTYIMPFFKGLLISVFTSTSYWNFLIISIGICLAFYIVATLFDKFRILLWNEINTYIVKLETYITK